MSGHGPPGAALPRPTRRGVTVAAIAVVAALLGWEFGGRSLNAVTVPALALLAVSAVAVVHVERPTVRRRLPRYATVGETVRAELDLAADRPAAATVREVVPPGVAGEPDMDVTTGRRVEYDLTLAERGVHEVGPTTVSVSDVFGLWRRTFRGGSKSTVTAFPRVHALARDAPVLSGYVGPSDDRERFEGVRKYVRGDSLRDVNWKASAKRAGDLVVTEFGGDGATRSVTLGVTAADDAAADAAAEAAASVATCLLDASVDVGVRTPGETLDPGHGAFHRREILSLLARFEPVEEGGGPVDADVHVSADRDGASVSAAGGEAYAFGTLRAAPAEVVA